MTTICFAIFLALIILYLYYRGKEKTTVRATTDNRDYTVLERFDKQEAAEILADVNAFNLRLINYIYEKYKDQPTTYQHEMAILLKKRYKPSALTENDPPDPDNTSFVQNKGDVMALCLREKDSGHDHFHDMGLIIFVSVHELSHIANTSVGHGHGNGDFWHRFSMLLKEAKEMGEYQPIDYSKNPTNYCSLWITDNPYYDSTSL